MPVALGLAVLCLFAASFGLALVALRDDRPPVRSRAWGLLCFFIAASGLALSVGLGRRGSSFVPRYYLFVAPALCWAYFAWDICGPPAAGRLARVGLFMFAVLASGMNFQEGLDYGRARGSEMDAFEADMRAGESASKLVARHQRALFPYPGDGGASFHDFLVDSLKQLHRAGIGSFRFLGPEPAFREIRLSDAAAASGMATKGAGGGRPGQPDSLWTLDPKIFLCGLAITGPPAPYLSPGRSPDVEVFWNRSDGEAFSRSRRYAQHWYPVQKVATCWIYEEVHQLRISTKLPRDAFDPSKIILLVPAAGDPEVLGRSGGSAGSEFAHKIASGRKLRRHAGGHRAPTR